MAALAASLEAVLAAYPVVGLVAYLVGQPSAVAHLALSLVELGLAGLSLALTLVGVL